jgi:hypothetical protein
LPFFILFKIIFPSFFIENLSRFISIINLSLICIARHCFDFVSAMIMHSRIICSRCQQHVQPDTP